MPRLRRSPTAWRKGPLRRPAPVLFLVVAVSFVVACWFRASTPSSPESLAEGTYTVQRVVDGDTLLLTNRARVRLIGADAPETVKPDHPVEPFGPEAARFTRRFIEEAGGRVRLQFDRERVDQYHRFLAYVFVGDRMLNEELIREGLATAETGFRYSPSMKTRFRRAEDEARAAQRGIWSGEGRKGDGSLFPAVRYEPQARVDRKKTPVPFSPVLLPVPKLQLGNQKAKAGLASHCGNL